MRWPRCSECIHFRIGGKSLYLIQGVIGSTDNNRYWVLSLAVCHSQVADYTELYRLIVDSEPKAEVIRGAGDSWVITGPIPGCATRNSLLTGKIQGIFGFLGSIGARRPQKAPCFKALQGISLTQRTGNSNRRTGNVWPEQGSYKYETGKDLQHVLFRFKANARVFVRGSEELYAGFRKNFVQRHNGTHIGRRNSIKSFKPLDGREADARLLGELCRR